MLAGPTVWAVLVAAAAGLLWLGFISETVLKGFIVGLALTIITDQLPTVFGIEAAEGDLFEKLWGFVTATAGGEISVPQPIPAERHLPLASGSTRVYRRKRL